MKRYVLFGVLVGLFTFLPAVSATAHGAEHDDSAGMESRPGILTDIVATPGDADTFVEPSSEFVSRQNLTASNLTTPSITVFYTGFSPEAQAAFQYAVDIWKSLIVTTVGKSSFRASSSGAEHSAIAAPEPANRNSLRPSPGSKAAASSISTTRPTPWGTSTRS